MARETIERCWMKEAEVGRIKKISREKLFSRRSPITLLRTKWNRYSAIVWYARDVLREIFPQGGNYVSRRTVTIRQDIVRFRDAALICECAPAKYKENTEKRTIFHLVVIVGRDFPHGFPSLVSVTIIAKWFPSLCFISRHDITRNFPTILFIIFRHFRFKMLVIYNYYRMNIK